jgi:hypothetical protein
MIRVLSFGYIEDLLRERHKVLSASGFEVTSLETKSAVVRKLEMEAFDVLVIGHGVPLHDRNEIAGRAKCQSGTRIIFLYRYNINRAEFADAVLSVDGCAEHLIETIDRIASESNAVERAPRKKRFATLGDED